MTDHEYQRRASDQLDRSGLWSGLALVAIAFAGWAALIWFIVLVEKHTWLQ